MNGKSKRNSVKELIFGRGFYFALVICLAASLFAIWAAARRNQPQSVEVPVTSVKSDNKKTTEKPQPTTKRAETGKTTTKEVSTSESTTAVIPEEPAVDTQVPYYSFYANPTEGRIIKFYTDDLVFSETMNDYRTHNGVDYLANSGDTVRAINKGEVVRVYEDEMLGDVIEINHAHSVLARYCGVKSTLKAGDMVNLGDSIGTVTMVNFEANEDTHVHLEILYGNAYVDPLELMSKSSED